MRRCLHFRIMDSAVPYEKDTAVFNCLLKRRVYGKNRKKARKIDRSAYSGRKSRPFRRQGRVGFPGYSQVRNPFDDHVRQPSRTQKAGAGDHLGLNASLPATCFPTAATMANIWDRNLCTEVGMALGEEAMAINVKRKSICEYYL